MSWLFAACVVFWAGIFIYTRRLSTRQQDLDRRIDALRPRLSESE